MRQKIFRSQLFMSFAVVFFSFFLVSSSFSDSWAIQDQDWKKEFQAGIDLYNTGRYEDAIQQFKSVLNLTQDEIIIASVYHNLSICYFYSGDMEAAELSIKNLLLVDPSRQAPDTFPNKYKNLYTKVRKELSGDTAGLTREEPQKQQLEVLPYKAVAGEAKAKKKKGLLLIIGGTVLAAGVGAGIILLAGKEESPGGIQVNSNPQGAQVYLDGVLTGQLTNCTLNDIEPGSHQVKVIKEGYVDQQSSVSVTNGETAQLNFTLNQHSLSIMNINGETHWMLKENVEIKWETSGLTSQLKSSNFFQNSSSFFSRTQGSAAQFPRLNFSPGLSLRNSIRNDRQSIETPPTRDMESAGRDRSDLRLSSVFPRVFGGLSGAAGSRSGQNAGTMPGSPNLPFTNNQNLSDPGLLTLTNIRIELLKGNSVVKTIAESTENDGFYNWTVADDLADGSDYSMRISCSTSAEVYVQSPNFKITREKTVRFNSTDTPKDLPDLSETISTINVNHSGIITHLKYHLTITHTYIGDLVIDLWAPDSTQLNLANHEGSYIDDMEVEVDTPAFNGKEMLGNWDLIIRDEWGGDSGRIEWWWIEITYSK